MRSLLSRVESAGRLCGKANTLCIDLKLDSDSILKQMQETTRYEVRRAAARDSLEVERSDGSDAACTERFAKLHRQFVAREGLDEPDYGWMTMLNAQGALNISFVKHRDFGDLAFHLYLFDQDRARLLWSGHIPPTEGGKEANALLGRANKLLHWEDISHFKRNGLSCYDLGGVYLEGDDKKLAGVTRFKLGFGGSVVSEFHYLRGVTLPGRLAVLYRRLRESKLRYAQFAESIVSIGGAYPWISRGSELL